MRLGQPFESARRLFIFPRICYDRYTHTHFDPLGHKMSHRRKAPRLRYLTAMTVRVSAFVGDIQNSQEITHEKNLVGSEEPARTFVQTMSLLGDRLGPLLLQLPPSFSVEGMGVLEDFLSTLPEGPRYAVEVRHRSWLGSDLPQLLREHGVALTLIDYPWMPRMEEATTDFAYIRWLGDRREFPEGHTHLKKDRDNDLLWWAGVVDRFLQEGKTVFAYANNHYQNHSPSTLERFLELRR
jgi:uncharacterized protein YecE (DUF72 family)